MTKKTYLENCQKVPIKEATTPKGGLTMIYEDHYWTVVDDCILFFGKGTGSPQCNQKESIAKSVRDRLCPEAEVQHLPFVFRPTTSREWC